MSATSFTCPRSIFASACECRVPRDPVTVD